MPDLENVTNKISAQSDTAQHGQETTHSDPQRTDPAQDSSLNDAEQKALIECVRRYKQSWFLQRRMIIRRVLKAYEFFKGNQFISFDPESFQWYDALDTLFQQQQSSENVDLEMYQFATNFYQMLGFAFVAALSAQVPKTRFLPDNAEREEDIATAKAASRVQEIIERQNRIKSLHKQGLLFLWMAGCYFRHTRYIVDADRAGTHTEPVAAMKAGIILSERFYCPRCGATAPAKGFDEQAGMACPQCGTQLSGNDYYPAEEGEMPTIEGDEEVPNGMVAHTLYSPLMVDAAPWAKNLAETPILNVDEEVDIASLRESFPTKWDQLREVTGPTTPENSNERFARIYIYTEAGSRSNMLQDLKPTLSRTWIQPWALNSIEDRKMAEGLRKKFPKGVLLVNVGDLFLEAREAKLTDQWTWGGTIQEMFGLFPPAVGDAAIPLQQRINDVANITHEYMDRLAAGMVLYNSSLIDGEALNGQPMMVGRLNPVRMKNLASAASNRLEDAIVQIKAEIDNNIYSYTDKLVFTMQLISGTPPQIFGGSGDPHVETMGGQQQQLSTAMGKLSLFWDNVRDEHAQASELSVKCAQENMTDDWISVTTDESGEYRNDYVRLDEMEGNVHAYPETDQSFPMTWQEVKNFWEKLIEFGNSGKNPYVNAILDDPTNQQQIATWTGVPGLVVPGQDMRNKVLRIIDLLLQQQPIKQTVPIPNASPDPNTGVPPTTEILLPSIMPDRDVDDFQIIVQTVRQYAQKNFDKSAQNSLGWQNLIAYYRVSRQFGLEEAQKQAAAQGQQGGEQQ
jgi:hypothetical protein